MNKVAYNHSQHSLWRSPIRQMGTRAPGPDLRTNSRVGHRKQLALTCPARHKSKPDRLLEVRQCRVARVGMLICS